jgi:sec-independent protein translocase protein TatA
MDLGAPELLIILAIALLIFGSNKLPKLARSLGQASREFKAGTTEGWVEDHAVASPAVTPVVEPPGKSASPTGEPTPN